MTSAVRHVFFVRIARERAGVITSPPLYLFVITSVSSAPSYDCHHERTSVREGPAFRVAETIYSPLIIFFHDTGHQLADLALVGAESGGSAVEQPQQVALKYSARLPAFAQVLESPK